MAWEPAGPTDNGRPLTLALPKGRLLRPALDLLQRAGFEGLPEDESRRLLFADTSGAPNVLKTRGPAVAEALAGGPGIAAAFDVDSIRKDLRTMIAEAKALGTELPLAARALAVFDDAVAVSPIADMNVADHSACPAETVPLRVEVRRRFAAGVPRGFRRWWSCRRHWGPAGQKLRLRRLQNRYL